ncbi:DUF3971 domain-containing protein [Reyranella sp.]|uniref:YhdP family protein n=1 Tax=Reyranella sp. TaxID=1929291 RepID=UPI003BACED14
MVKRTVRVISRVVVVLVLAVVAVVVVAALRLMEGPVDLEFLKARILAAADVPGNDYRPDADRITLEWGGISQPMRVVFTGLHFTNPQGQVVAAAPSASLTFDARSVFQGMLLPTSITIQRPTIEADLAREGGMLQRIFTHSDSDTEGKAVAILMEQLLAEPNYKSLIGQLDVIEIQDAKVTLRDLKSGITWMAPAAWAQLKRDEAGVRIRAQARITGDAGNFVDVSLSGVYARDRSHIKLELGVEGFKPSMLADLSPDVALLRGFNVALSGRLRIDADGEGDVRHVTVDVSGPDGTVTLPGVLPASHAVKAVNFQATMDTASNTARIERADFEFGAAKVKISGLGERKPEGQTFTGRAEVRQIPVDHLGDYWPLEFAAGGRDWALANLSLGEIDVAADFALSTAGNDLEQTRVDRLVGMIDYRGLKVHYMPHMPELEGVSGTARYEGGSLHFDVATGSAVGLTVTGATIDLKDLNDPPPQYASIRIPITGAAQDVVRFLARPKLGLPKEVLYDYRRLGGTVAIDVSLHFPLLNALAVEDLEIKADATLSQFSLKGAIGAVDLTDASVKINYVESELAVSGTGKLDGTPVEIGWREMFGAKVPFRQRYELKGTLPAALVAKAGFPPLEPYVTGPIGTAISYQVATNGTGEVVGRFDLRGAQTSLPPIDWSKPAGAEGTVQATMKLAAGGKLSTVDFDGRGSGLTAKGTLRFAGDNALQQATLQQFRLGRTDVAGSWTRQPGGVELSLQGATLEMPRVRALLKERDAMAARNPGSAPAAAQAFTRMTLKLQQVLTERGSVGYVNGRLDLAGDRISFADLSIGAGKGSTFRVSPAGQGRKLFFYVADFGTMLREAGWLDGLVNGYLHIEGQYDDVTAGSPLDGFLKLGPYRLQKVAPRPNIGTLNSAIDGLSRAGNALQQFDGLDANISRQGDRIAIKNGRTSGQSIGLTAQGYVDLGNDTARLNGVVVPAFALNNLLSNVPLLGPLLTGGKDGGVFAVSYQLHGPLDDLQTDVNMMSAVTPGALREIFTGGGAASGPPGPSGPTQPPTTPESQRAP